jgi:hypothetical protein
MSKARASSPAEDARDSPAGTLPLHQRRGEPADRGVVPALSRGHAPPSKADQAVAHDRPACAPHAVAAPGRHSRSHPGDAVPDSGAVIAGRHRGTSPTRVRPAPHRPRRTQTASRRLGPRREDLRIGPYRPHGEGAAVDLPGPAVAPSRPPCPKPALDTMNPHLTRAVDM